jgi:hypothetical protein
LRLQFGLGAHTTMDKVAIRWPNGETENVANLPAGFIYTIVEGSAVQQREPYEKDTVAK